MHHSPDAPIWHLAPSPARRQRVITLTTEPLDTREARIVAEAAQAAAAREVARLIGARRLLPAEPCEGCGGAGTYDGHALHPDDFAPGERGRCECCGGEGRGDAA